MNSFTEALAYELRGTGVTATVAARAPPPPSSARSPAPRDRACFTSAPRRRRFVAAHAYRAMMAGKAMSLPGWRAKLGLQLLRFGSRGQARAVTARLNQVEAPESAHRPKLI